MGHLSGKPIYEKLAKRVDTNTFRSPMTETFYNILRELYTVEEAVTIVNMPFFFSDFDKIIRITGYERTKIRKILDGLVSKGLVIDLLIKGKNYYQPSPFIVGFFEITMMRKADPADIKKWAQMFYECLSDEAFYKKNWSHGEQGGILRALPHLEAIKESDYVHILDYESADAILESQDKFALELCSCRHEKLHAGVKRCDIPLDTCTSFGIFADTLIRNGFAKEISKSEMKEKFAQSKKSGLMLCADNVQKRVLYVCHCCGCCCNVLQGINKHGYTGTLVTSNYIIEIDHDKCTGCGKCTKACHTNAIKIESAEENKKVKPVVDEKFCMGCGVCVLNCGQKAMKLVFRGERVLTPETTFERLIIQHLESGSLVAQLFDNPNNIGHKFMRGFVGAIANLNPVKKALLSDVLRSQFFSAAKKLVTWKGDEWSINL
jgi:ferredoxin